MGQIFHQVKQSKMEVTGNIKLINDTQAFESGFCKREMVVTTNEQYPQDLKIEFVKDKCEVLNNYKVGDNVTIGINITGNEYNDKYYVTLRGWKIGKAELTPMDNVPVDESDPLPF